MIFLYFLFIGFIAPLIHAQEITIFNRCDQEIYVWEIGSEISESVSATTNVYVQRYFEQDPISGGKTIAISKDKDGIFNGSPQLNLQYTVDASGQVWYKLNTVNGSPFEGKIVWLYGPGCEEIRWENGVRPPSETVKICKPEWVWLDVCYTPKLGLRRLGAEGYKRK